MENIDNKILFLIVLAAIVTSFVLTQSPKKRAVVRQNASLNVNISEQNLLSNSKIPTQQDFNNNKTSKSLDISVIKNANAAKSPNLTPFRQDNKVKSPIDKAFAETNATQARQPLNFSFSNLSGKLEMNLKSSILNEGAFLGELNASKSPADRAMQDLNALFGENFNIYDLNLSKKGVNFLISENARKILGLNERLDKQLDGQAGGQFSDTNGEFNKLDANATKDDAPSVNADKGVNYNVLQAILREFGVNLSDFNLSEKSASSPSFAPFIDIATTSLFENNQTLQKLVQIELYDEPRLLRRDFVMKRPPKNFPAKLFLANNKGEFLWQGVEKWELWRENKAKSKSIFTLVSGIFYLYKGGENGYLSDELAISLQKDKQNRHFIAIITPESFEKRQVFDFTSVGEHHIFALGEQNFIVARLFNRDFTQWWRCKLSQASFRCTKISANSGEIAFSNDTNSYEMRLSRVGDSVKRK